METKDLMRFVFFYLAAFLISINLTGQPTEKLVKVIVAPDHTDWVYKTGENVKIKVTVTKNS